MLCNNIQKMNLNFNQLQLYKFFKTATFLSHRKAIPDDVAHTVPLLSASHRRLIRRRLLAENSSPSPAKVMGKQKAKNLRQRNLQIHRTRIRRLGLQPRRSRFNPQLKKKGSLLLSLRKFLMPTVVLLLKWMLNFL